MPLNFKGKLYTKFKGYFLDDNQCIIAALLILGIHYSNIKQIQRLKEQFRFAQTSYTYSKLLLKKSRPLT